MEKIILIGAKTDIDSLNQQLNDLLSNGYSVKTTLSVGKVGAFVLTNSDTSDNSYHEPIGNPSTQSLTYKQKKFIVNKLKERKFNFEKYGVTLDNVDTLSKKAAQQLIKDIINSDKENVDNN